MTSKAAVDDYANAKLHAEWPNKVQWIRVRQKVNELGAQENKDKETERVEFEALRDAIRYAKSLEREVEVRDDFIKKVNRLSIHEDEVLADVSSEIAAVHEAEEIRIATERRLEEFYRRTHAHVTDIRRFDEKKEFVCSTNSFPDFKKYIKKKEALKGIQIVDPDPSCELLAELHNIVTDAHKSVEYQTMDAAKNEFITQMTPALMNNKEMRLVPSDPERQALQTMQSTQTKWFEYTATRQEELLAEKAAIEAKLDALLHLSTTTAPARKKSEPKAPFEAGYDKEARKRRAIEIPETSTKQHPAVPKLRRDLTRVIASLHIYGHEPTIRASPYQSMFDIRNAVGAHPQMRVAEERARLAKTKYPALKKKKKDAIRALNEAHAKLFLKLREYGPEALDSEEALQKDANIVSIERIKAAKGPYDVLQVPRGCSEGDVRFMMKTYFQRAFGQTANNSVQGGGEKAEALKLCNAACQLIFPNHQVYVADDAADEDHGTHASGGYADDFPLVTDVTELQKSQTAARDRALVACHGVLRTVLADMMLPLVRALPPRGLHTGWFPTKPLTKSVIDQPVFELFRHPGLKLVSFHMAEDSLLFSTRLVDESRVRFEVRADPKPIATILFALPSGLEFEAPFEVLTLAVDATTLVFPELAAALATKAQAAIDGLSERVVDAILQDVTSHAPHKKSSKATEDWRRRSETLTIFRSEVSQRMPPFLKEWPRWCCKFITPPHEQDVEGPLPEAPVVPTPKTLLALK